MLGVVPASVADTAAPGERLEQRLTAFAIEAAAVLVDGIAADQVEVGQRYPARRSALLRWAPIARSSCSSEQYLVLMRARLGSRRVCV
jgi:hypothetical protein